MRRLSLTVRTITAALLSFALVTGGVGVAVRAAESQEARQAAEFIDNLGEQAIAKLGDESVPFETRVAAFRSLLGKGFAMEAITRFVLGRYWRAASDAEQSRFRETFEEVLVQRFLPLFEGYSNDDFVVEDAMPDPRNPSIILVNTRIAQPGGKSNMVQAGWRVRHGSEQYQIVDVIAEGVSMAITLRSEYNSVIQRNGGRVSALTDLLREKLAEGAYQPKTVQGAVQ